MVKREKSTKKRLPKGILWLVAIVLVLLLLGGIAGAVTHLRLNPVRKLEAQEIQSITLGYTVPADGILPNWQKELTTPEEIEDFITQYQAVKQSAWGTLPRFVTHPPEPAFGEPGPSNLNLRVIQKDGEEFSLRIYTSMDEDERYDNGVLWVSGSQFFPAVETSNGVKVATRRFRCEEASLTAFTEYLISLAKTGKYWGS